MQNDFAVSSGLKNRALALELEPQNVSVNKIAIVRDGHLPAHAIDHEGLRVFDRARAGRRITRVPDRTGSFELLQFGLAEDLRDKPHVFVDEKGCTRAVARHDPGAFLAAMLQSEQAVIRQHSRVWMTEHAEETALVVRERLALGRVGGVDVLWRGHAKHSVKLSMIQCAVLECASALALSMKKRRSTAAFKIKSSGPARRHRF